MLSSITSTRSDADGSGWLLRSFISSVVCSIAGNSSSISIPSTSRIRQAAIRKFQGNPDGYALGWLNTLWEGIDMLKTGQTVIVITDKGIAYEADIVATAKSDSGLAAYKVAVHGAGSEQLGQWHKACDVFVEDQTEAEEDASWKSITKG
jgi:hypothetical protein